MKGLKLTYLSLFLLVSVTCFSQDFSSICRTGTLNDIIKAIHNNTDKNEKAEYDKTISKLQMELNNTQTVLKSMEIMNYKPNNKSESFYSSDLIKNQEIINSLINSQILSKSKNTYGTNPLLQNDIRTKYPGTGDKSSKQIFISKNVIDALKYNPNLSAEDKKQILHILSMR